MTVTDRNRRREVWPEASQFMGAVESVAESAAAEERPWTPPSRGPSFPLTKARAKYERAARRAMQDEKEGYERAEKELDGFTFDEAIRHLRFANRKEDFHQKRAELYALNEYMRQREEKRFAQYMQEQNWLGGWAAGATAAASAGGRLPLIEQSPCHGFEAAMAQATREYEEATDSVAPSVLRCAMERERERVVDFPIDFQREREKERQEGEKTVRKQRAQMAAEHVREMKRGWEREQDQRAQDYVAAHRAAVSPVATPKDAAARRAELSRSTPPQLPPPPRSMAPSLPLMDLHDAPGGAKPKLSPRWPRWLGGGGATTESTTPEATASSTASAQSRPSAGRHAGAVGGTTFADVIAEARRRRQQTGATCESQQQQQPTGPFGVWRWLPWRPAPRQVTV